MSTTAPTATATSSPTSIPTLSPTSTPKPTPTATATLAPPTPPPPRPHLAFARFDHKALLLADGRVLVAGGFSGVANNNVIVQFPLGGLEIYDPGDGLFTWVPESENLEIFFGSPALADDDTFLLFGVWAKEDGGIVGAGYSLDTNNLTWSKIAGPLTPVGFPVMAPLADGRVLAVGGWDLEQEKEWYQAPANLNVVQIYNFTDNTWELAAPMNRMTDELRLIPLDDGRIMAFGVDTDYSDPLEANAEIYDPRADTWDSVDIGDALSRSINAVRLMDGSVIAVGLSSFFWKRLMAISYNPATDSWIPAGSIEGQRREFTLSLLPDGRVLLAGGGDPRESDVSANTEVFDPGTNAWELGPALAEPRYFHSATLLEDGSVLLVGGIGALTTSTGNEEIYPLDASEIIDDSTISEASAAALGALTVDSEEAADDQCEPLSPPAADEALVPVQDSMTPQEVLEKARVATETLSYSFETRIRQMDEEGAPTFCLISNWSSQEYDFRLGRFTSDSSAGPGRGAMAWSGDSRYVLDSVTGEWYVGNASSSSTQAEPVSRLVTLDMADLSIESVLSRGAVYNYQISGTIPFEVWDKVFGLSNHLLSTISMSGDELVRVTVNTQGH